MHDGALAEKVGQRHPNVVEHAVAAAMMFEHSGVHPSGGCRQVVKRDPRFATSVAFGNAVAKHELHAAPLIKTVGQRQ